MGRSISEIRQRRKKQKRKNDEERNQKILKEIEEEMKKIMEESGSLPTDISDFEDLIKGSKLQLISSPNYFQIITFITVLCALTGFIDWFTYDKLFMVPILIGFITGIDYLLCIILDKFLYRLVLRSLGTIKIVPSIIGFVLAGLKGITYISFGKVLLVFLCYNVLKKIVSTMIKFLPRRKV